MAARVRLTPIQLALANAIRADRASDYDVLADALGVEKPKARQAVANNIRAGVLACKLDGGFYALDTLKLTKRGEELLAATEGGAPAPKPRKAPARAAMAKPAKAAPAAAQGDGDGLEDCTSVTFDAADLHVLSGLVDEARAHAERLAAAVEDIRKSPKLGTDGAYLVRLLAKLHAKGEG